MKVEERGNGAIAFVCKDKDEFNRLVNETVQK